MAFDRILVATDFSENAEHAVQWAARLAEDAPVHVVHVIPQASRPVAVGRPHVLHRDGNSREPEEEARREIRHHATEAGVRHAEHRVRHGEPGDQVARVAEEAGADLVVVGATGESGLRRAFLGSTARDVIRRSPVSVLVARERPPAPPAPVIRRVAVATDFHDPSQAAAAEARRLAAEWHAELLVVHAVDPALQGTMAGTADIGQYAPPAGGMDLTHAEEDAREAIHRFNEDVIGGDAREHVVTGRPDAALTTFAGDHDVDVLVTGTHGPGPVERFLVGSVAENVAEGAPCSVLVVRPGSA